MFITIKPQFLTLKNNEIRTVKTFSKSEVCCLVINVRIYSPNLTESHIILI